MPCNSTEHKVLLYVSIGRKMCTNVFSANNSLKFRTPQRSRTSRQKIPKTSRFVFAGFHHRGSELFDPRPIVLKSVTPLDVLPCVFFMPESCDPENPCLKGIDRSWTRPDNLEVCIQVPVLSEAFYADAVRRVNLLTLAFALSFPAFERLRSTRSLA